MLLLASETGTLTSNWPLLPEWSWSSYSLIGWVILGGLAVIGIAVGLVWSSRRRTAVLAVMSWLVVISSGVAHLLTVWVLQVDPGRDRSGIPLAEPFSTLGSVLNLALHVAGPLLIGFTAVRVVQAAKEQKLDRLTVLMLLAALYTAWILPWVGTVMWD